MVTNEFYHQTATTTFLTTPHRTAVIAGKLITATMIGFAFWLVTTVLDLIGGVIFLEAAGYGHQLGEWGVTRAILLNLLAYAIWTIFGVGFGTLITNQLGAVLTAVVLYLVGTQAAQLIFFLLSNWLDSEALLEWQVVVPSIASQLMITGFDLPGSPPQWVGAAVLIGYAVVTGTIGIMLTRRRDIS
jgi:ABC-2 type transport system permease protein